MKLIGVYGAGGYGREIMPLVREQVAQRNESSHKFVFIDDSPRRGQINGHDVLDWSGFCVQTATEKHVCLAVADPYVREALMMRCREAGIGVLSVRASSVVVMDNSAIGEGALLSPFVTITSNARIGRCFHANLYSYVGHDCKIGDFVTFAPKVACNGSVVIEDYAYIGTGAELRQGTSDNPLVISTGAVVGMGAVVTKSVAPGTTVVGNPARLLKKTTGV